MVGLTRAAAIAAATACAASFTASLLADVPGDPCQGDLTPIFFSGMDNPETTRNIKAAQDNDGRFAHLTRWKSRPRNGWYNKTATCNPEARATFASAHGNDTGVCDEYPFHSTNENQQTTATVTLHLVPSSEGPIQRSALGGFYGSCKVGEGSNPTSFVVVPVPTDFLFPSSGFCPTR